MHDLIDFVSRRSGLDRRQSEASVAAVLEYFTARLPSPVVGRIHELLHGTAPAISPAAHPEPSRPASSPPEP